MDRKIIIGSRGSDLALWQANYVLKKLKEIGMEAEIRTIKTQGDKIQDLSFDKMEGKGFFTKEIEEALLNKNIDLAVHSYKDLETNSPSGLTIAAVSEREDPSETLLIRKNAVDVTQKFSLKKRAIVGTSSVRRKAQLLSFRDDIQLKDLRGNVPTRVQKLRDRQYDAILLAAAGVERLGLDLGEFHTEILDPKEFIPAPAQGVLALQIRDNDKELSQMLRKINNTEVEDIAGIERKVLNLFEGGCQLPLGVYCEKDEEEDLYKVWVAKAEAYPPVRQTGGRPLPKGGESQRTGTPVLSDNEGVLSGGSPSSSGRAGVGLFPKRIYFESKKKEGLADRIADKICLFSILPQYCCSCFPNNSILPIIPP